MDRVKSALCKLPIMADKLNDRVASSRFGRMFRLEGSNHVCSTLHEAICKHVDFANIVSQPKEIAGSYFLGEIRAGVTTFTTMAYIIAVNVTHSDTPRVITTQTKQLIHRLQFCHRRAALVHAISPTALNVTQSTVTLFARKVVSPCEQSHYIS